MHSAKIFATKKVKNFQDFFPTVNNTVKFGGIFCTAYIFSNISGKIYREIGGKNFRNFWVANIVVNFCSIFCTVFAVFFAFLILLQNFHTKKMDFLLCIILQIFSQKIAQIFAYIFSDLKYYSKNCRFLCFAYIFANICAKINKRICGYFCKHKYYLIFLYFFAPHKFLHIYAYKICSKIYGNFCAPQKLQKIFTKFFAEYKIFCKKLRKKIRKKVRTPI